MYTGCLESKDVMSQLEIKGRQHLPCAAHEPDAALSA